MVSAPLDVWISQTTSEEETSAGQIDDEPFWDIICPFTVQMVYDMVHTNGTFWWNIRTMGFFNTITSTTFNDGLYFICLWDLSRSGARRHISMVCRAYKSSAYHSESTCQQNRTGFGKGSQKILERCRGLFHRSELITRWWIKHFVFATIWSHDILHPKMRRQVSLNLSEGCSSQTVNDGMFFSLRRSARHEGQEGCSFRRSHRHDWCSIRTNDQIFGHDKKMTKKMTKKILGNFFPETWPKIWSQNFGLHLNQQKLPKE